MDLRINNEYIDKYNLLNFLHDKVASSLKMSDDCIEVCLWDTWFLDKNPSYRMIVNLGEKTADFVNVYLYKIENGEIKGKISDIYSIANDNVTFEIIEIGYMHSTLFLKGSIIEDGLMNRNNIIIEFCFENENSFIDIKESL